MMARQARPSAKINGFDTHMILEAVPAQPSERSNGHQAINQTSRHYAEALGQDHSQLLTRNHKPGISAQQAATCGWSWTVRLCPTDQKAGVRSSLPNVAWPLEGSTPELTDMCAT